MSALERIVELIEARVTKLEALAAKVPAMDIILTTEERDVLETYCASGLIPLRAVEIVHKILDAPVQRCGGCVHDGRCDRQGGRVNCKDYKTGGV